MTKFWLDGQRGFSCHKVIEECGLLSPEYHHAAQTLQRIYYPLEVAPGLDHEARVKYMVEWVTKAHELLVDSGISRAMLKEAVAASTSKGQIKLRSGIPEMLRRLQEAKVPVLVFSAGIADVLEEVIRIQTKAPIPDNVSVVSNRCIFKDRDGALTGFEDPVFHVFNKRADTILHTPFFRDNDLASRSSVVLLGDSLGDLSMAEGLKQPEDVLIAVGFLNDRPDERLPDYLAAYDVVVIGDPGVEVLDELLFAHILAGVTTNA